MNKSFSIKEALQFGWQTTLKNFWFWAGIMLILFVLRVVTDSLQAQAGGQRGQFTWVTVVAVIIGLLLQMGIIRVALKFVDGKKAEYKDLWSPLDQAPQFILAAFMAVVIAGVGTILLVVPGIIAGLGLSMATYLVLDTKLMAVAAIK